MTEDALNEFKKKNGTFPKNMIIYRDGVGDSQRKAILMNELPQIKAGVKKATGDEESVKVMIILVNKRIN